jgi:enterochelin esterase family protein
VADGQARAGSLEGITVHSAALAEERQVGVYVPARFRRSRHYPLLVVHDGFDYLRYANLQAVFDRAVRDLAGTFTDHRRYLRGQTPAGSSDSGV